MANCDQFPSGLRVLVVDDDTSCLIILEKMLLRLMYQVTICSQAEVALTLLREKKGFFDLVLSDVHMPGMNGYKLLQQVGLEMDLPVIMMSVDGRTSTVMTGINNGACDYLIKPIRSEQLKNIWQHVVRKKAVFRRNSKALEDNNNKNISSSSRSSFESVNSVSECLDVSLNRRKKKKRSVDREDNEVDNEVDDNNSKKSRVVWSIEMHQQFVNAVNQLGIEKAVPKRILELMNAPGLSRGNVASHLQKFRLYLKRLSGVEDWESNECENIQATLYGRPIDNHISGGFGVWIPNDNNLLGGSQNDNFSVDSNRCFRALKGPVSVSSTANVRQQCDGFNNSKTEYIIKQGNGSNVDEESWNLERSSRQRKNHQY